MDVVTDSYREAVAALQDDDGPDVIALVANAAEIVPRLVADGVAFDVVTDQTAAHDPLRGYVPLGYTAAEAAEADPSTPAFRDAVFSSLSRT